MEKEFMNLLMEVKVSIGELNIKFDNITEMKDTLEATKETAMEAKRNSQQNAEAIRDIKDKLDQKADSEDVEHIVKEKDNWQRGLPAWFAVIVALITFLSTYL